MIFVAASLLCCFATSITVFTCARLFQGIGGAGGIVLSRSIAADLYSGKELAKLIAILSAINNLAPVAAPVTGGCVAHAWGWQGIFVILLALGVILLALSWVLHESLGREKRFTGIVASVRGDKIVLGVKGFPAYSLMYAMAMAALFAYISATPFIVQEVFGYSELQFSLVFATNAIALAAGSALSLRFRTMSKAAVCGTVIGSAFAAAGIVSVVCGISSFIAYEVPTFLMLFGIGLVLTGSTSHAMNLGRNCAGAASAVIGGIGYITGGLVSPLAGIGNICITSNVLCLIFLFSGVIVWKVKG